MLASPEINPVALQLGPFAVHWYGLMYVLAFSLFLWLGCRRLSPSAALNNRAELDDLLFYGVLGVVLGGRLGYILFYKPVFFMHHPLDMIKVWQGGMSFHGGFLGVLLAMVFYCRKTNKNWLRVMDFIAPLVPLGLAAGRAGNFINGELWGRVTSPDTWSAMIFRTARTADWDYVQQHPAWQSVWTTFNGLPRHPSQLYQLSLEGVALFVLLWCYSRQPRATGSVSGLFLVGYGLCRFIAEYAREPDDYLGLLALNLSMGQWLSLPMIVAGVGLMLWSQRGGRKSA